MECGWFGVPSATTLTHVPPVPSLLSTSSAAFTESQKGTESSHFCCFLLSQSAYPPRLSWGLPKYHHIILYLLVISQETQQQLQVGLAVERNGAEQTGSDYD